MNNVESAHYISISIPLCEASWLPISISPFVLALSISFAHFNSHCSIEYTLVRIGIETNTTNYTIQNHDVPVLSSKNQLSNCFDKYVVASYLFLS